MTTRRTLPVLLAVTALLPVVLLQLPAGAETVQVRMFARAFSPADLEITSGDEVVWVNTDDISHTVTAEDGSFDQIVRPGQRLQRTFGRAGTVDYYCRFHGAQGRQGMSGTITVVGGTTREAARISGSSRFETAVALSQYAFPTGADEVYLSSSDVNPDALVGGTLTRGPILLVPSCGALPDVVAAEIRRLDPVRVVALGGLGAVCDDMLDQAVRA